VPRRLRRELACIAVSALLGSAHAPASERTPEEQGFDRAVAGLQRGAHGQAIDELELLSDLGFVHPDAAFNRAVAYSERARASDARPGDLGRAAAALSEVLELRPGDGEAERALHRVRQQIARRHARAGGTPPVLARPSLARAVAELLPENVWAVLAACGSALLTAGLVARWMLATGRWRLAAASVASIGGLVLVLCGSLAVLARHHRTTSRPAVVVAGEARLDVEAGEAPRGSSTIPEGALLYVLSTEGERAWVEWGSARGWVQLGRLRILPRR
jgi:hypothetical protein